MLWRFASDCLNRQVFLAERLILEHFLGIAVKHHTACIKDHRTISELQSRDRVLLNDDGCDALLADQVQLSLPL